MERPLRIALAAFGLAALVAAAPPADAGGGHGPPPIDRVLEKHAERLGLSDGVLAEVREIAAASEDEGAELKETLRRERDVLHALLSEDDPDPDAVMQQTEVAGAAETALHKHRLRTLLAVRALLTTEQRQGLVQIFEERRERRKERWKEKRAAEERGEDPEAAAPPE